MSAPGLRLAAVTAAAVVSVLAAGCGPAPAPAHSVIIGGNIGGTPAASVTVVPAPPAAYASLVCVGPDGTYGVRGGNGAAGTIEVVRDDPACKTAATP